MKRRLLIGAAATALLAACGTTVPYPQRTPTGSALGEAGTASGVSQGTSGRQTGTAAPRGTAGAMSGLSPTSTASGGTASPPTSASSAAGAAGPGADTPAHTASPLLIGVTGYDNTAATLGALGVGGLDTGDEAAEAAAVIAYLNAHGGIAGHPLRAVYHMVDLAKAAANEQAEKQAMCADFTQDHHVFAVFSSFVVDSCLNDARVPVFDDIQRPTEGYLRKYAGLYYGPSDINFDREWRVTPQGLQRAGFFGSHPKIGVIMWGPEDQPILDNDVRPTLAEYGLTVTDSVQFADSAGEGGDAQGAVLKFQSEGIDHVLSIFTSPLFFMEAAENQRYYPSYGINSEVGPALALQGNAPKNQLAKTMGIGWVPAADVDQAHQPGTLSATQRLCDQIQTRAGNSLSSGASYYVDLYCDELLAMRDAFAGAPAITVPALWNGYVRLGTSFASAVTFASRIGAATPDGVAAYRVVSFDNACSCFRYRGRDEAAG